MKTRGFSLIELLVVVSIIGILLSIVVLNYNQAKQRSRDKVRKTDLKELQLAIELYKSQNGRYPAAGCGAVWSMSSPGWAGSEISYTGAPSVTSCVTAAGGYITGLVPDYIARLPEEPASTKTAKGYVYTTDADGSSYKLMAHHSVENQLISAYTDEFARYAKTSCGVPYPAAEMDVYAVYSRGAECW